MSQLHSFKIALANLILTLLILHVHTRTVRPLEFTDIHGNLLSNNDVKYPPSACCIVPTCQSPSQCYQTLSCGYMCSSGKYPPAEYSRTSGYNLKDMYTKYDCRFGDCRYYDFTCSHCQDPREKTFNIYLARQDCKDCYYLV